MGKVPAVKESCCTLCSSACDYSTHPTFLETVKKFANQLNVSSTSKILPLCPACYTTAVQAVEWRDQIGEVEKDVRSLQRIILKMMRQLTSLQNNYLGEMTKLKKKIKAQNNGPFPQGVLKVVAELSQFQEEDLATSEVPEPSKTKRPKKPKAVAPEQQPPLNIDPTPPPPLEPISPARHDPDPQNINIEPVIISQDLPKSEPTHILPDVPQPQPPKHRQLILQSCKFCGKMFKCLSQCKSHMRLHTGELPFKCNFCDKAFRHQTSLIIHRRQHTGERPYQCPECPKNFSRPGSYKGHLRTHTGERPHACQLCDMRFTQKGYLRKHMMKMHENQETGIS